MNLFKDEITSIDRGSVIQTFDVSVIDNHNFLLSNRILSHNSGKSTGAISSAKYTSKKAGIKFNIKNICPNEQVYVQLVPYAKFQEQYIIDEQLEQHTGLFIDPIGL